MLDTKDLVRLIDGDAGLRRLHRVAAERSGDDPAHDLSHCMRVALWTLRLCGESVPARDCIAAALLHDFVNVSKDSPERALASELSAREAGPLLEQAGFDEASIDAIQQAIVSHSFSRGERPRSLLSRALQDADRLEALGAIGIFRTVSTGVKMGAGYFDSDDPWAERRPLDDRRHSTDHFFTKLLDLEAGLHNEAARAEGRRRTSFMRRFLQELGEELGIRAPGAELSQ